MVATPENPAGPDTTGSAGRHDLLPQVFGRYLLVQRLSRGGMGEIFLAKHGLEGFEKLAVIKKVLPHLSADASFISRFVDEAQVAIKLQHVNVAQVFEVGRVGDEYFLALEYVEGRDLRRTLALLNARKTKLPVDLALFIGREMANGLAYAHRRTSADGTSLRLVHCDISPPNVLVSFEGETKVIDFGIAKSSIRGTASDPKMGFGKFGYMAPEQLIRGGVVDHRTDIYAGGVVLYELLTGKRLYEAGNEPDYRALARKVAKGEHDLPSDSDPALAPYDELVATALRPRPEDRYQTAAELRDAIQQCLVGINPTISTDQLGAYMRELFADEMAAMKELHDRIARAQLADFQEQLTQATSSIGTITFALANLPLAPPNLDGRPTPAPLPPPRRSGHQTVPPQPYRPTGSMPPASPPAPRPSTSVPSPTIPPPMSSAAMAAVVDHSIADGTGTADRLTIEQAQLEQPPRSRTWLYAALIGAIVAVGVMSWAMMRGGNDAPAAKADKVAANNPPPKIEIQPIDPPPTPPPNPGSGSSTVNAAVGSNGSGSGEIEMDPPAPPQPPPVKDQHVKHTNPPPHEQVHHPDPHAGSGTGSGSDKKDPPKVGMTKEQVSAKAAAMFGEYKAYQAKFGQRLDREFNDLAGWLQVHPTDYDEAAHRIDGFRSKLHE